MSLTEADRLACNKIIAEALGVKPIAGYTTLLNRKTGTIKHDSTLIYPDFCGDDAAAMGAIKQFFVERKLTSFIDSDADENIVRVVLRSLRNEATGIPDWFEDGYGEGDNPIAAALAGAMIMPEAVVVHPDTLKEIPNTRTYCLKPALEAVLKGKK